MSASVTVHANLDIVKIRQTDNDVKFYLRLNGN